MTRPTAKIAFDNSRENKRPFTIYVELVGEDYTLLAGEELEIIASGTTQQPWFHVRQWDDSCQVFFEGDCDDFAVMQNGERIYCGHNRQVEPND